MYDTNCIYEYYKERTSTAKITLNINEIINIEQSSIQGHACRVVKAKRMGFCSGSIDKDKNELYVEACNMSSYGIPIDVKLEDNPKDVVQLLKDNVLVQTNLNDLITLCQKIIEKVENKQTQITIEKKSIEKEINNSYGVNCKKEKLFLNLKFVSQINCNNETIQIFNSNTITSLEAIKPIIDNYNRICELSYTKDKLDNNSVVQQTILSPEAISPLIFMISEFLNGKSILSGNSIFSGRMGEKVFSESFTLYEDPYIENSILCDQVDDEGVDTKRKILIKNGRVSDIYTDIITVSKFNSGKSSGNGFRKNGFSSMPTPNLTGIRVENGNHMKADLISSISSGIYIDRIAIINDVYKNKGIVNVNIIRAYKIKNGKISGLITNLVAKINIFEIFNDFKCSVECELIYGAMQLPYIVHDKINLFR